MEMQKFDQSSVLTKYSREQIDLIKNTVCKGATDDELMLFLLVSKKSGLDPFSRQIYSIKRSAKEDGKYKDVRTIQTGIDGYRLIAARTGLHAGTDEPIFKIDEKSGLPISATITVYRLMSGQRIPFTATARYSEYVQEYNGIPGGLWKKMPFVMTSKCAESLCLRMAFPQELSGIYTNDEMSQAESSDDEGGNAERMRDIQISKSKPMVIKPDLTVKKSIKDVNPIMSDKLKSEAINRINECKTEYELKEVFTKYYKISSDIDFQKQLTEEKDLRKAEISKLTKESSTEFFGEEDNLPSL